MTLADSLVGVCRPGPQSLCVLKAHSTCRDTGPCLCRLPLLLRDQLRSQDNSSEGEERNRPEGWSSVRPGPGGSSSPQQIVRVVHLAGMVVLSKRPPECIFRAPFQGSEAAGEDAPAQELCFKTSVDPHKNNTGKRLSGRTDASKASKIRIAVTASAPPSPGLLSGSPYVATRAANALQPHARLCWPDNGL